MSEDLAFQKALALIRTGRYSNLEIIGELEEMLLGGSNPHKIAAQAQKYWTELKEQAFDASVAAFKAGESFHDVVGKIIKVGLHPYDSEVLAGRAKAKAAEPAEAEVTQEGAKTLEDKVL